MPITHGAGNLLTQDVDALVNTVNTQGVMGKGIALQFKRAWPEMFRAYRAACTRGEVTLGHMHVWETGLMTGPRFIINFPTKNHWRSASRMADIESGLNDLVAVIRARDIRSIAIPPLGCGNGGLRWSDVEPTILAALRAVGPDVDVRIFPPAGAPAAAVQPSAESRPNLTPARAALLALMREYERVTFDPPSLIAVQKLAYFLQDSGQALRLDFQPHIYGPYADNLRKSLRAMEGQFITGFGDGSATVLTSEPVRVRPEIYEDLDDFLAADPETQQRVTHVLDAIGGFTSDYGLELLATVHWVVTHDADAQRDAAKAHELVRDWSPRKSSLFTRHHVDTAWSALQGQHLVGAG